MLGAVEGSTARGSEVENMARVTPGCVRDADRQTKLSAFTKIETQFCKLRVRVSRGKCLRPTAIIASVTLFLTS